MQLTEHAAALIRSLVAAGDLPPGGGLRIAAEQDEHGVPGLHLGWSGGPEEEDVVVAVQGARVFLDPSAADALEGQALEAEAHGDNLRFELRDADA